MSIRVDGQLFQSTLPQGERRQSCAYVARYIIFQSTLPQGERHNCLCSLIQQSYFNPRSHKGSDDARKFNATANKISIHAPTRGATQNLLSLNHIKAISIHAPTRGATCSRQHLFRICYKFQSTLPQGERQYAKIKRPRRQPYFNPRSHKGSDHRFNVWLTESGNFNPRSHKGSDISRTTFSCLHRNFNPRSHKGSDFIVLIV